MKYLKAYLCLSFLLIHFAFTFQEEKVVVYLVGDSTCADKDPKAFPETGWGTPFKTFFNENIVVENRAKNGRSTRSFIEEGRWNNILNTLKAGDYVFIQFGHNDEVPTKATATTPEEFQANLKKYISETRAKKANPVLLTPVTRRSYQKGVLVDSHQQYAQLIRDLAKETDVPLIDMTVKSMGLVNNWGEDQSKLLYHHLEVNEHPNFPEGKVDNTHFSELGARKMAQLVLQGIIELDLGLTMFLINGD